MSKQEEIEKYGIKWKIEKNVKNKERKIYLVRGWLDLMNYKMEWIKKPVQLYNDKACVHLRECTGVWNADKIYNYFLQESAKHIKKVERSPQHPDIATYVIEFNTKAF